MCGVFGLFGGGIVYQDRKVFRDGMVASTVRGPHSTGIGIAGRGKGGYLMSFIKSPVTASELMFSTEYNEFESMWSDPQVMMGHTRYATTGAVNGKNAHPFRHGDIMLAHNGVVHNKDYVSSPERFDVDSEAICYAINKHGLEATLNRISGAYTLTYYNVKERSFNIIRNDKRPLFIAKVQGRQAWFYASEEQMLEWVIERNDLGIEGTTIELPVHTLMQWKKPFGSRETMEMTKLDISKTVTPWQANNNDDDDNSQYEWYWRAHGHPNAGVSRTPAGPTKVTDTRAAANETKAETKPEPAKVERSQKDVLLDGETVTRFREKYKLQDGALIKFWLGEYYLYPEKPDMGFAVGTPLDIDASNIRIKAFNIKQSEFSSSKGRFRTGEYKGVVASVWYSATEKCIFIGCRDISSYVPDTDKNKVFDWKVSKEPETKEDHPKKTLTLAKGGIKIDGPNGVLLTPSEFVDAVKGGCFLCQEEIRIAHSGKMSWHKFGNKDTFEPVCPTCTTTVGMQEEGKANNVRVH